MRILYLLRRLSPLGGAERSALTLIDHLSSKHDVKLCGYSIDGPPPAKDVETRQMVFTDRTRLPVEVERLGRYIEFYYRFNDVVRRFNPDLIFSQHELAIVGAKATERSSVPHVLFLHDQSMIPGKESGRHVLGAVPDTLVAPITRRLIGFVVANSDLVIANSEYIRSHFDEYWGTASKVVYPFIDPPSVEQHGGGDVILHVNPSRDKGIDVTLRVAERLPSEQFVVVGPAPSSRAIERTMSRLDNVQYEGYCSDMSEVYRRAKLVLMPTHAHESFGMVPIEAGFCGVPTLCSGRGGLRESVGSPEFVVETNDPGDYIEAIKRVLAEYETYTRMARINAESKLATTQLKRLNEILSTELQVDLGFVPD